MPRNLFRRVEIAFALRSPRVHDHVEEIIDWFWRDNVKARVLNADGLYLPVVLQGERFNVQGEFLAEAQRRRKAKVSIV
jgi:polyphosphate kinase